MIYGVRSLPNLDLSETMTRYWTKVCGAATLSRWTDTHHYLAPLQQTGPVVMDLQGRHWAAGALVVAPGGGGAALRVSFASGALISVIDRLAKK